MNWADRDFPFMEVDSGLKDRRAQSMLKLKEGSTGNSLLEGSYESCILFRRGVLFPSGVYREPEADKPISVNL